jgi:hypothetical protein
MAIRSNRDGGGIDLAQRVGHSASATVVNCTFSGNSGRV